MRQDNARVGQQPAPIARMMPALAQIDDEVEIHRSARAEKDRRPLGRQAGAVGGDQYIGGEAAFLLPANLAQTGRADLLAGLQQQDRVEPKPSARLQHGFEGREVDRMLALIVGGAAAVEPVALPGQLPRRQSVAPLRLKPANHIAVAIAEHRGRRPLLAPLGDEDGAAAYRIVEDFVLKAEPHQGWRDLVVEIGAEYRAARSSTWLSVGIATRRARSAANPPSSK